MKTAVVILNWNGLLFLEQFMATLCENTKDAEIVVIDNHSTDESVTYLQENFPEVKIVLNAENGGYAQGYNEGLEQLKGQYEYYMLLNSDVEVTANWLSPLLQKIEGNPRIAGVQPKILSYAHKSSFEYAGACGGFIDKNYYPFCRGRIFNTLEEDKGQYDNEMEVFWTSGACMLVRAEVFHQTGGFDGDYFAHMEEIDWCWRTKNRGYQFHVVPSSKVYHVGGGTLQYDHPRKTYLNFRNSLYMIHKNHNGWVMGKIFYRLCLDGLAGLQFLMKLKGKHLTAIIRAHFHYYRELPVLRKKRKVLKMEKQNGNPVGKYKGSILKEYFLHKKTKFSLLNKKNFVE